MSADMQMARGAAEGEINLAVGEPFFLQRKLLRFIRAEYSVPDMEYPAVGGEPGLVEELKLLYNYKHIIVTNGAKQAIEAAFFGFKTVERRSIVSHRVPHWPSYPTLARSQGLDFNVAGPRSVGILCTTSPNNPDGAEELASELAPGMEFDLWDAAYAQPLYGFTGIPPPHRVAVFSAAKQLGLSGLRVGWLATNDDALANAASYFVEITTSGVSIASQAHLAACLRTLRDPEQMAVLTERSFEARTALLVNGVIFTELIGSLCREVHGVPNDGSGMFAWFRVLQPESFRRTLKDAKVKVVTGEACGKQEPGWYRMSMGHYPEVTREALTRIKDGYYKGWVGK